MELRAAHLKKLREEKRFNRVTISPLRASGACDRENDVVFECTDGILPH